MRLKQEREKANLSCNALTERAGLPVGTVSRLEREVRSGGVTVNTAAKLAATLGVRIGWLLAGEVGDTRQPPPVVLVATREQLADPALKDVLAAAAEKLRDG